MLTGQLLRKILNNVLVSSEMDLNAKSQINSILLSSGWFTFCLSPDYSLTFGIKNIIWEGDRTKSATSKQYVLVLQTQGFYVGNPPRLRYRGIYRLISSFSAYEHRFDSFTDWVLMVIPINPKCLNISPFCHGYRRL